MIKKSKQSFDCAIIGGGPAGMAAALYLARFQRKTVLFSAGIPRVTWAPKIQNLLGYPAGICGSALLKRFEKHLAKYPSVQRVHSRGHVRRCRNGSFEVTDEKGRIYRAKKVILAGGVNDIHPEIPDLVKLRRKGLLRYCSICDGYEMRGKKVAVLVRHIGDIPKVLFLGTWVRDLTLFIPPTLRIPKTIRVKLDTRNIKLVKTDFLELRSGEKRETLSIQVENYSPTDYKIAYVELGCQVNSEGFRFLNGLRKSSEGYLEASAEQRTSVRGVFAIGDCVNRLSQVSVALGQAAIAATNVHDELL